jgi:hypothetical protein
MQGVVTTKLDLFVIKYSAAEKKEEKNFTVEFGNIHTQNSC